MADDSEDEDLAALRTAALLSMVNNPNTRKDNDVGALHNTAHKTTQNDQYPGAPPGSSTSLPVPVEPISSISGHNSPYRGDQAPHPGSPHRQNFHHTPQSVPPGPPGFHPHAPRPTFSHRGGFSPRGRGGFIPRGRGQPVFNPQPPKAGNLIVLTATPEPKPRTESSGNNRVAGDGRERAGGHDAGSGRSNAGAKPAAPFMVRPQDKWAGTAEPAEPPKPEKPKGPARFRRFESDSESDESDMEDDKDVVLAKSSSSSEDEMDVLEKESSEKEDKKNSDLSSDEEDTNKEDLVEKVDKLIVENTKPNSNSSSPVISKTKEQPETPPTTPSTSPSSSSPESSEKSSPEKIESSPEKSPEKPPEYHRVPPPALSPAASPKPASLTPSSPKKEHTNSPDNKSLTRGRKSPEIDRGQRQSSPTVVDREQQSRLEARRKKFESIPGGLNTDSKPKTISLRQSVHSRLGKKEPDKNQSPTRQDSNLRDNRVNGRLSRSSSTASSRSRSRSKSASSKSNSSDSSDNSDSESDSLSRTSLSLSDSESEESESGRRAKHGAVERSKEDIERARRQQRLKEREKEWEQRRNNRNRDSHHTGHNDRSERQSHNRSEQRGHNRSEQRGHSRDPNRHKEDQEQYRRNRELDRRQDDRADDRKRDGRGRDGQRRDELSHRDDTQKREENRGSDRRHKDNSRRKTPETPFESYSSDCKTRLNRDSRERRPRQKQSPDTSRQSDSASSGRQKRTQPSASEAHSSDTSSDEDSPPQKLRSVTVASNVNKPATDYSQTRNDRYSGSRHSGQSHQSHSHGRSQEKRRDGSGDSLVSRSKRERIVMEETVEETTTGQKQDARQIISKLKGERTESTKKSEHSPKINITFNEDPSPEGRSGKQRLSVHKRLGMPVKHKLQQNSQVNIDSDIKITRRVVTQNQRSEEDMDVNHSEDEDIAHEPSRKQSKKAKKKRKRKRRSTDVEVEEEEDAVEERMPKKKKKDYSIWSSHRQVKVDNAGKEVPQQQQQQQPATSGRRSLEQRLGSRVVIEAGNESDPGGRIKLLSNRSGRKHREEGISTGDEDRGEQSSRSDRKKTRLRDERSDRRVDRRAEDYTDGADLNSKEEQLTRKIKAIREKNAALVKRKQEVDRDKQQYS